MAITTVSNDNKNRVDAAIEKQTKEAGELLIKASHILHDTGDTESELLDKAMSNLQLAIGYIVMYRGERLG